MTSPAVVVVGSVHMDLVASAPRLPRSGETLPGNGWGMYPGGKGGNQVVQAALQEVPAAIVGRVGADFFGERLRATLREKGVDVSHLGVDCEAPTGASVVLTGAEGEYASVIVPGAGLRLTETDLAAAGGAIAGAAVLLAQLELNPEIVAAAVAMAATAAATTVVLNASPIPNRDLPRSFWVGVDVLIVNEVEAEQLLAETLVGGGGPERAALVLAERLTIPTVVVTLGKAGVAVAEAGATRRYRAWPVDVVDSVGAGDAFAGTLAAELARGGKLDGAVRLGIAAGALAVTKAGAYDALPTLDEVRRFLAAREGAAF